MAIIGSAYSRQCISGYYGDASVTRLNAAASSTNPALLKAGAGTIHAIVASNNAAAARYLKIYDLATTPVAGTSVPLFTIALEQSTAPFVFSSNIGILFANGIGVTMSTGVADTDTGNTSAGDVEGFILWT